MRNNFPATKELPLANRKDHNILAIDESKEKKQRFVYHDKIQNPLN